MANSLDQEAILVAAIFHDSGYGISENRKLHAQDSAVVAREYLAKQDATPAGKK